MTTVTGTFTPAPGRAPMRTILRQQVRMELLLTARRGEAVVLAMGVPLLVLLGAVLTRATNVPTDDRPGYVVPGVLALTVMSTAFTGQAITTGYERSYGVLKRLGASPLTRPGLLFAKTAAILCLVALQVGKYGSAIEVVNKFGSYFYGSILGVFGLAILTPKASARGAFYGLIAGMVTVVLVAQLTTVFFLWHNVIGAVTVFVVGLAITATLPPRKAVA